MRQIIVPTLITAAIVASSSIGFAQEKLIGTKTSFTLTMPPGWRVVDAPPSVKLDYKIALLPPANGFAPNLVVTDEPYQGAIDVHINAAVQKLSKMFTESKVISKTKFDTHGGVAGYKLVMRNTTQGKLLRQVAYLFPTKSGVLLTFTLSSLAEQGFKYDKSIDNAMRNIVLDK